MEKIEKLEKFFYSDLLIKKAMYQASPNNQYGYNIDQIKQYSDNLIETLDYIEDRFIEMFNLFNLQNGKEKIKTKFIEYKQELINRGLNYDRLTDFYQEYISSMREELVNKVGESCVGYDLFGSINIFKEAKSINELLHAYHQSLINNENIYESLPKTAEKLNNRGYPIRLYGEKISEVAQEIYDEFNPEIYAGWTDILSLNNKVIMMIRDKGHALSVEITLANENNKNNQVDYFIPKICNIDMVNNLPGVNKVDETKQYTRGMFDSPNSTVAKDVIDMISKVPTDQDEEKKTNSFYFGK